MSLVLIQKTLPSCFNNISMDLLLENKKSIGFVASTIVLANKSWKVLRNLSLSGNSDNPVIKFFHNILRKYLNQGLLMRSEFYPGLPWKIFVLLKGNSVIVNYGSYGTVPVQVLDHHHSLQLQYEISPDKFVRTVLSNKYEESRCIVAKHLRCNESNLVFTENITYAMNCVLRSLLPDLKSDSAVLCINIGYSAVLKTITVLTKRFNVQILQLDIVFPITSEEEIVNLFKKMFEKHQNIKLAVFDHIASASAVVLPIHKIGQVCREYNVISIVDGAHAPGQLELNLDAMDVDIYMGNLHKWYFSPKSCGILHVNPKYHDLMQPTAVSHGCYGDFHTRFFKQATKNYASQLTAGFAVTYMDRIGGISHLHEYITPLVEWAVALFKREWGTEELASPSSMKAPYMRVVLFPQVFTEYYGATAAGSDRMIVDLIDEFNLSMFCNPVQGRITTRVSAQIFSGKTEYYYAAACIKRKANELKERLRMM